LEDLSMGNEFLERAKAALPLRELWQRLALPSLPDRDGQKFSSPFREDFHPSCTVYDGKFHDWARGLHLDVFGIFQEAKHLDAKAAFKPFLDMAGISFPNGDSEPKAIDWDRLVLDAAQVVELAQWRRYSPEFCVWLNKRRLIGWQAGEWALPYLHEGRIVSVHIRHEKHSWEYRPTLKSLGLRVRGFEIGEVARAERIFVGESQWDVFAILDYLGVHQGEGIAGLCTRSADNAKLLARYAPLAEKLYLVPQNDEPGKRWLATALACCPGAAVVAVPSHFEDVNAWLKDDASDVELETAIQVATRPKPEPGFSAESQRDFSAEPDTTEPESAAAPIDLESEAKTRLAHYLDDPEPFPQPMRGEAFHGLMGEIVKKMAGHCESSPEVLLLQGIVIMGNVLGRSAYAYAGGSYLFTNEFVICVGETSRGRKGTAYSMWDHLLERANPDWSCGCIGSQIQTGEGLVYRIRDERMGLRAGKRKKDEPPEEQVIDEGVSDKRLLILEEEFSYTLKMAQRSGNTLSETLRQAWDSRRSLSTGNKNSPLKASDPHVSLIGHTTRDELLATLKLVDLSNGLANRILWCAARRTGDMPNAELLDWNTEPEILAKLDQIFRQRPPNTALPRSSVARATPKLFGTTSTASSMPRNIKALSTPCWPVIRPIS
jgi:hypothetical protein